MIFVSIVMNFLYVLLLTNNKYYIGHTIYTTQKNEWVAKYKLVKILELNKCNFEPKIEDEYVIKYMKKYGIDNVRGGSFTKLKLTKYEYNKINSLMNNMKPLHYIYTLLLKNNKYYIGKTKNPKYRLQQHYNSYGSEWTKKYSPIKLIQLTKSNGDFNEDIVVFKYMRKYGINNVRGGSFSKLNLTKHEYQILNNIISTSNDTCFKCRKSGHFAKNCSKIGIKR
jgi:predicted GIY-YIG superfamily endonuclease